MKEGERGVKNRPYPMPGMSILFTVADPGYWKMGERFADAFSIEKDFGKHG